MGLLNYEIDANDVDEHFLDALKSLFRDKRIVISVHQIDVSTEPEQTVSEMVAERESDSTQYIVPGAVFAKLADSFLEDEEFDIASEIKKYKAETI